MGVDQSASSSEIQALFGDIRRRFIESLPRQLDQLKEACGQGQTRPAPTWETALEIAHQLAGSGATFELPTLSKEARALEQLLASRELDDDWHHRIEKRLSNLQRAARAGADSERASASPEAQSPPTRSLPPPRSSVVARSQVGWTSQSVAVWTADPEAAEQALSALNQFGFKVHALDGPPAPGTTHSAWICDLDRVSQVGATQATANIIALVDTPDFDSRLQAVRVGCKAVLARDLDADELASTSERIVPFELETPRVLIVEDDALMTEMCTLTLSLAGLEVRSLAEPRRLLDVVGEFRPNLVLMDMRLPNCNGIELASILRQDDHMVGVPIVFLTAEAEPARAVQALEVGADDFLVKPVSREHLASVVLARLERSRVLRSFLDHDSLTGLLSHARTLQRLDTEVASALRTGSKLTLAILDLDHFKEVNDTHGHATGDRVLRSIATLLRRQSRRGDAVGRCGGEEFVALLRGVDAEEASKAVERWKTSFSKLSLTTPQGPLTATFSAGVASLAEGEPAHSLWDRADAALYEAKHQGRDRVVIAQTTAGQGARWKH